MASEIERIRVARTVLAYLMVHVPAAHAEELHALAVFLGPVEALSMLTSSEMSNRDREKCLGDMTAEQLRAHVHTVGDTTRRTGARVLIPEDVDWPARLDDLSRVEYTAAPSSAMCLWVRGAEVGIPATSVAICGSSAATPYGTTVAADLAQGMAAAGWTVATTSGFGITSAAVRGALVAGGRVVVVMPGGIDRTFPEALRGLFTQVANSALLVSAYPPGTEPTRQRFTDAGRLLAGMTSGTVLVEAAVRSSCLAVIEEAALRGRRAMAVPGPVNSKLSAGPHQVLRENRPVRLVRHAIDVLTELSHVR